MGRDFTPIDPNSACSVSRRHTKSYLRHLFVAGELLAGQIASLQNLSFYLDLVKASRDHIVQNNFVSWKTETIQKISQRLWGGSNGIKPGILDRYIIRQYFVTFLFTLCLLSIIAVVFDISERIEKFISKNVSWWEVIRDYYLNFVPWINSLLFPLCTDHSHFFTSDLQKNRNNPNVWQWNEL